MNLRRSHPYLDHAGPIPFAHRGGTSDHPENTLPAFQHAADLGYRYLETDVHATSDGVLLAFHDDTLDRVTDASGVIADLPYAQVALARVAGSQPIPRLDELFEAFPNHRFNLDAKHDSVVEPLVRLLSRHDSFDRVCIGSFSDRRLTALRRRAGPALLTALGPRAVAALRARLPNARLSGACAQVPPTVRGVTLVDGSFVRAAHRRNIAVHVWTIDEPGEMHRLLDLGVDGIMTDRPVVLRSVLEERGQWVS